MGFSIRTDIGALHASREIAQSSKLHRSSLNRLTTGQRINSAADDPANLIISEKMRSQLRGVQSSVENLQNARNMMETADGALREADAILVKLRGLALKASQTATLDDGELSAIESEVQSALKSLDGIARNTTYGSKQILDGSLGIRAWSNDTSALVDINRATFEGSEKYYDINVETAATRASTRIELSSDGTLSAAQSLRVMGNRGTANLGFSSGAEGSTIADEINGHTLQTGVIAEFDSNTNTLTLSSAEYGANSFVEVSDLDSNQDLLKFTSSNSFELGEATKKYLESTTIAQNMDTYSWGSAARPTTGSDVTDEFYDYRDAADEIQRIGMSIAVTTLKKAITSSNKSFDDINTQIQTALSASNELKQAWSDLESAEDAFIAANNNGSVKGSTATYSSFIRSLDLNFSTISSTDIEKERAAWTSGETIDFRIPSGEAVNKISLNNSTVASELENSSFGNIALATFGPDATTEYNAVRAAADTLQQKALQVARTAALTAIIEGKTTSTEIDEAITTELTTDSSLRTLWDDFETAEQAFLFVNPFGTGKGPLATFDLFKEATKSAFSGMDSDDIASEYSYSSGMQRATGTDAAVKVGSLTTAADGLTFSFSSQNISGKVILDESANSAGYSTTFRIESTGAKLQIGGNHLMSSQVGFGLGDISSQSLGLGSYLNPDYEPQMPETSGNSRFVTATLADIGAEEKFNIREHADIALDIIDQALSDLTSMRARIGGFVTGTLDSGTDSQQNALQNLTGAESLIRDTEFAMETASLTRSSILVQAGVSISAQANLSSQTALQILNGTFV